MISQNLSHREYLCLIVNCINITNSTNKDPCYEEIDGVFNLGLHIGSIFIILVSSFLGVFIPIIISYFNKIKIFTNVLFYAQFFGSGVIMATGFVHIFPEACNTLQNSCLPKWFSSTFTAAAGLFAMLAAMIMHFIEWLCNYIIKINVEKIQKEVELQHQSTNNNEEGINCTPNDQQHCGHSHSELLLNQNQNKVSTYLLQFGISIHSIIIGIALGIEISEFAPLLIALSFHQFFEGIGLGCILINVNEKQYIQAIIFGIIFTFTTPIGICIGIGIALSGFSPTSSLIGQGILDSFAAGILVYAALVTLLSVDFETKKFFELKHYEKLICFIAFYTGAGFMSVLALWA